MQTATDYLGRTESAVRRLFDGIDSYLAVLRVVTGVTFITSEPYGPAQDAEFEAWRHANAARLAAARAAEKEFMAESFSLDSLCGAVLQIAEKGIEIYSTNSAVPTNLKVGSGRAKFCVGRLVRTVPLGLVIYAARNQHAHFNDGTLREPSASVFRLLASAHGYQRSEAEPPIIDPAFDLTNPRLVSCASNVTGLIGWRSYAEYIVDMRSLLGLDPDA